MAVTIVIPTLNCSSELAKCLLSILDAVPDLLGSEVFLHVQDGGSTDSTLQLLQDSEVPGLSFDIAKDSGVYAAMNSAIEQCSTQWIYFLGSDDRLLPGFSLALRNLKNANAVYYGNVSMRSDGKSYDGEFSTIKLVYRNICHQAAIYPVSALKKSLFNPEYLACADWAKNIELRGSMQFIYVDELIATYNDESGVSHNTTDESFERDKAKLCHRHLGTPYYLAAKLQKPATFLYQMLVK